MGVGTLWGMPGDRKIEFPFRKEGLILSAFISICPEREPFRGAIIINI
jgi:hypothetical protein